MNANPNDLAGVLVANIGQNRSKLELEPIVKVGQAANLYLNQFCICFFVCFCIVIRLLSKILAGKMTNDQYIGSDIPCYTLLHIATHWQNKFWKYTKHWRFPLGRQSALFFSQEITKQLPLWKRSWDACSFKPLQSTTEHCELELHLV